MLKTLLAALVLIAVTAGAVSSASAVPPDPCDWIHGGI